MKKIISIIAIFVILLSGCTTTSSEGGDGVVTVFNNKVEIDDALKAYAETWSEENDIEVVIKSVGGGADYGAALQAEFQSGSEPDIFAGAGSGDFNSYTGYTYDMTGEEWTEYTDLGYVDENGVTGFPMGIEGYGLIANISMLEQLGIDGSEIDTVEELQDLFVTLDNNKEELGIEAPLSFSTKETWITGNHLHNILLAGSGQTAEEASTAVEDFIAGDQDALAVEGFGEYTQMLMNYSMGDLSTIDYDTQVANFTTGKTALLFQGNWVLPNLEAAEFDTNNVMFIPHMYNENTEGNLAASVPSYYAVNKNQDVEASLKFLNDMALTEEGQNYMVNEAQMVPAFTNVDLVPSDRLSSDLMQYNESGNIVPWLFMEFPEAYTMNTYGPLYDNFYKNKDKDQFIDNILSTSGDIE